MYTQMKNKLVVISGCSGGGKSTLISELSKQGYSVIPEVGREIVKEQLAKKEPITPWENPQEFCELLMDRSIIAYNNALRLLETKNRIIFFDRSFIEGVSYFKKLNINKYDHLVSELRFFEYIFMVAPWEEIFCQDDERKHSFHKAVNAYERELEFYEKSEYSIVQIPKMSVTERAKFIISYFNNYGMHTSFEMQ